MSWYQQGGSSEQPPPRPSQEPPPPPSAPPPPDAGEAAQPYAFRTSAPEPAPAYGPPGAAPAKTGTDGMAIATFVLGLVSIFVFGLILGIVALFLSKKATDNIRASGGQLGGMGLVTAGRVLAIIGIIGWAIVIGLQLS
jgi:hypothetical protein